MVRSQTLQWMGASVTGDAIPFRTLIVTALRGLHLQWFGTGASGGAAAFRRGKFTELGSQKVQAKCRDRARAWSRTALWAQEEAGTPQRRPRWRSENRGHSRSLCPTSWQPLKSEHRGEV